MSSPSDVQKRLRQAFESDSDDDEILVAPIRLNVAAFDSELLVSLDSLRTYSVDLVLQSLYNGYIYHDATEDRQQPELQGNIKALLETYPVSSKVDRVDKPLYIVDRAFLEAVLAGYGDQPAVVSGYNFAACKKYGIVIWTESQFAVANGKSLKETDSKAILFDHWSRIANGVQPIADVSKLKITLPRADSLERELRDYLKNMTPDSKPVCFIGRVEREQGAGPGPAAINSTSKEDRRQNYILYFRLRPHSYNSKTMTIEMMDPLTLRRLITMSWNPSTHPGERLVLEYFYYTVKAWERAGIRTQWQREPLYRDGGRPRSFQARRGMLFVHCVQQAVDADVSLSDGWESLPTRLPDDKFLNQDAFHDYEIALDSAAFYDPDHVNALTDEAIDEFVVGHSALTDTKEVTAAARRIKHVGFYGLYMDPKPNDYILGRVKYNTAHCL